MGLSPYAGTTHRRTDAKLALGTYYPIKILCDATCAFPNERGHAPFGKRESRCVVWVRTGRLHRMGPAWMSSGLHLTWGAYRTGPGDSGSTTCCASNFPLQWPISSYGVLTCEAIPRTPASLEGAGRRPALTAILQTPAMRSYECHKTRGQFVPRGVKEAKAKRGVHAAPLGPVSTPMRKSCGCRGPGFKVSRQSISRRWTACSVAREEAAILSGLGAGWGGGWDGKLQAQ